MPRRLAAALALLLAACNNGPEKPGKEPPPRPPEAPSASASAPPPASAALKPSPAPAASPFAGTWEGRYDAKKGAVTLPPKVKDKALAADDGKAASGPGSVEITIGEGGEVRGKAKGALGASTITGKVEDGMLRASLAPEDPRAADAMFGVLVGTIKDDAIHGEIHVAGPDATVVRESTIELKRK